MEAHFTRVSLNIHENVSRKIAALLHAGGLMKRADVKASTTPDRPRLTQLLSGEQDRLRLTYNAGALNEHYVHSPFPNDEYGRSYSPGWVSEMRFP